MPWGRLDDQANGNAKLLALSDAGWRMWGCGLIYCQANLTNGFIPTHAIESFGVRAKNKATVADELCRSLIPGKGPLWHAVDGGYTIHDYLDWNDSADTILAEREKARLRMERLRGGSKRVRNAERKGERSGEQIAEQHTERNAERSGVHVPLPLGTQAEERLSAPDSDRRKAHPIRDLLDFYSQSYLAAVGAKPRIAPKDPAIFEDLLKQHDPATVQGALAAFMADTYAKQVGFPIGLFSSQFNRHLAASVKAAPKGDWYGHIPHCDSKADCTVRMLAEERAKREAQSA